MSPDWIDGYKTADAELGGRIAELEMRSENQAERILEWRHRIAALEAERDEEKALRMRLLDASEVLVAERKRLRAALINIADGWNAGTAIGRYARAVLAGEEKP
jgi:uncharacterized coiled-coil protein SlyX